MDSKKLENIKDEIVDKVGDLKDSLSKEDIEKIKDVAEDKAGDVIKKVKGLFD